MSALDGVFEDPVLELHEADGTVVTNDNWKESQQAEIEATGLQPSDDLESAIVATLPARRLHRGREWQEWRHRVSAVEVYDLDEFSARFWPTSALVVSSTMGDNVMIGGFIAGPTDTGPTDVIIRAIGPSLGRFDIADPLLDPVLELRNVNGDILATNDNWKDTQEAEIDATGLAPTDDAESAMLQTLPSGAYTASCAEREIRPALGWWKFITWRTRFNGAVFFCEGAGRLSVWEGGLSVRRIVA